MAVKSRHYTPKFPKATPLEIFFTKEEVAGSKKGLESKP